MKIINKLFDSGEIRRVVITMYGNDLLDQWAIQIRENYKNKQINYHYASQKMMKDFVMHPDDSILILSRDARNLSKLLDLFDRLPGDYRNDTLFVFDEVHGAGSNTFVENLSGRLSPYRYRLGLSATPEREYDEAGNDFLLNEIGEVIFEFTLQDAIQKGILFSSDRSRLVTTQRIGRALRLDKNNPEKKATVVDFVIEDSEENDNNADADRAEWLTELSQTRRCEHEK